MGTTITSTANEKIKYVRSLSRRSARYRHRQFVIEGTRLLEEALRAGVSPALVLFTQGFAGDERRVALLRQLREGRIPCETIAATLMSHLTDTVSPQGVLAVMPFVELPPAERNLILVVDQISIPGNLGTLLRSAEAAGVDQVWLTVGTVDPYSPKVVRGGMGVHFRLPIYVDMGWPTIARNVSGNAVYLAEAGASQSYYAVDWVKPSVLILGSEGHGSSEKAHEIATAAIGIPMWGATESLNVGVAGSVILFEAARQRRQRAGVWNHGSTSTMGGDCNPGGYHVSLE